MDRQDIDALLIGALYGELTPADEARLTAHLESHPTDKGALADLKTARQAVRESRIFELQLDPPQAVSALLLQEAHRRAPKRVVAKDDQQESWFYRFTRSFLAHPAMAAAAMLVLVVGVAGTLWVKKGDQFVDQQHAASAAPATEAEDTAVAATPPAEPTAGTAALNEAPADQGNVEGAAAGSGYSVGLDDLKLGKDEVARGDSSLAKEQKQVARERDDAKNKKSKSIVVDTPRPQPKELPERRAKGAKLDSNADVDRFDDGDGVVGGVGTSQVATGGAAPSGRAVTAPGAAGPARNAPAQSPPPPPPPVAAQPAPAPNAVAQSKTPAPTKPTTTATTTPSVTKEAEKSEAPKAEPAPAKDNTLLAWAKGEHSRTVALANKGDCLGAAKLAVAVQNRAPEYYTQFMATDRALKKCQAYIANERDADAERSGKARAQKRVNADEPASSR